MNDIEIKHLEFIQNIISRMNKNSFQLKGWMITIVSALLALFANNKNIMYLFIAIGATLLFWLLDTYYLQQERKFRGIYNDLIGISKENNRVKIKPFEMPIQNYKGGKYNFINVMWSVTIWPLYLFVVSTLLVGCFLICMF